MNTKTLALIIIFVALTITLNVAGPKIPAPYAPFLYYQLWEIPIVIAFLVLGLTAGLITSGVNTLILLVYFPGALPLGPLYNLIAVLAMMLGVYAPYIVATHGCKTENLASFLRQHVKMISISATTLGIILRVAVTSATNYVLLQQSPPVGFSYKPAAALAFLPLSALFNATVALYTIPTAFAVAIVAISITSRYKI
jgi:riboflavin transporter FmnP